jgi:hypothetical protein
VDERIVPTVAPDIARHGTELHPRQRNPDFGNSCPAVEKSQRPSAQDGQRLEPEKGSVDLLANFTTFYHS